MPSALWYWELESGKDYWLTLRDFMLWTARQSWSLYRDFPPLPEPKAGMKIGTQLKIKLPGDYCVKG